MRPHLIIVATVILFLAGCDGQDKKSPAHEQTHEEVLKITVLKSGTLMVDGVEASFNDVEKRLINLKLKSGLVWFYREYAKGEPPEAAIKVVELVVKHGLPITLSTKPDFSDYIDEQGISRPRR